MNIISTPILQNTILSPDLFILDMKFPYSVQAGQFVMINLPDSSKILPRPISIFNYQEDSQILSLLIRTRGQGTQLLSQLACNDPITVFGSLGKGFPTEVTNKNILLMGGGEGIAPMLLTSNVLKSHNNITLFAGFRHEIESSVLEYFDQNLPIYYTAQDHPTQGSQGLITDLLDTIEVPDYIYACGPISMMKAIYQNILQKKWKTHLYVSMENHMACGVGACMGCTIKGTNNQALPICTKGPVFLAQEVFHG